MAKYRPVTAKCIREAPKQYVCCGCQRQRPAGSPVVEISITGANNGKPVTIFCMTCAGEWWTLTNSVFKRLARKGRVKYIKSHPGRRRMYGWFLAPPSYPPGVLSGTICNTWELRANWITDGRYTWEAGKYRRVPYKCGKCGQATNYVPYWLCDGPPTERHLLPFSVEFAKGPRGKNAAPKVCIDCACKAWDQIKGELERKCFYEMWG